MAYHFARKYSRTAEEFDEAVSKGFLSLAYAAHSWIKMHESGAKFSTYAAVAIKRSIWGVLGEMRGKGKAHLRFKKSGNERALEETAIAPCAIGERIQLPEKWDCGLTKRHRDIVRLRFGIGEDHHTLEEVGRIYGITPSRARQIESSAILKLAHHWKMNRWGNPLDEYKRSERFPRRHQSLIDETEQQNWSDDCSRAFEDALEMVAPC